MIVDARRVQERPYLALEIGAVDLVHLGGDPELPAALERDADGEVGPLLGTDAAEEGEISALAVALGEEILGNAVMHGCGPARPVERPALRLRDGDERGFAELGIERLQLGDVESAVQRREKRRGKPAEHRQVQAIDVEMHHVERAGILRQALQHHDLVGERRAARLVEAQRLRAAGAQLGARLRIAARVERHIVAQRHQLLGQIGDDALGPAIEFRRHAFGQGRNLGDLHAGQTIMFISPIPPFAPSPSAI